MKRVSILVAFFLLLSISGNTLFAWGEEPAFESDDPWSEAQREIMRQQREKMKQVNNQANLKIMDVSKWRDQELDRVKEQANSIVKKLQKETNDKIIKFQEQAKELQEQAMKLQKKANAQMIKLQKDANIANEKLIKEAEKKVQEITDWHKEESERIKVQLQQRLKDEGAQSPLSGGVAPSAPTTSTHPASNP